jgi:hypothetical protein
VGGASGAHTYSACKGCAPWMTAWTSMTSICAHSVYRSAALLYGLLTMVVDVATQTRSVCPHVFWLRCFSVSRWETEVATNLRQEALYR